MNKKNEKKGRISRLIKAPIRALRRARDLYIRSMNNCAGSMGSSAAVYGGTQLPKSFSVSSTASSRNKDDDFRELVRASSTNSVGNKNNNINVVNRSHTVAIGRIDEDKELGDAEVDLEIILPRNRSYPVAKRSTRL